MGNDKRLNLNKGKSIRIIFRYLATAVLIWVALPDITQALPPTGLPVPPVEEHLQPIPELPASPLVEKEAVKPLPTQDIPKHTGCEAYRAEISKYNWNVSIAMKVMKAESGCRTTAIGDNRVIGGIYAPSCGLFQIRTLKGRPSCDQLKHPATNIAWAYKLYGASGWSPWSVCKTVVRCY